jgi:hypothetical protein
MKELSEIQRKTHNHIKEVGEIQTTNLQDKRMWGSIPNHNEMGLIEVFKKIQTVTSKVKKEVC